MSFPRYPAYKDSGIEWIKVVPTHWSIMPMYSVVDECDEPNLGMKESNLLSLSYGHIVNKDINSNDGLLPESFETYQVVETNDIVLRLTDLQNDQRSLRSAIVKERGIITSAYLAVRPRAITPSYLGHLLRSYDLTKVFYSMGGGLRQSMKFADLKRMPVLVPPVEEQVRIAGLLDHETSKIDALVSEQEQLITLLKEKRQAVISHAVTKGLDPSVPMKDSGVEWLGEVPAHWQVNRLQRVVKPGTSVTYGIVQAGPDFEDGIPYIRTSDMASDELPLDGYPKTSPEIDASYARSKVSAGDLVIAIRATVGKCLPVPKELDGANLTQGTARIAPGPETDPGYLLAFINGNGAQTYFDRMAKGATFREITLEVLRKTPVLVPPLAEQRQIASWVMQQSDQFLELIREAEHSQVLLKERRSALISAAVTGQIDVRGLAPAQEQAA